MRALLALLVFGGTAIGREIALNLPCNNELDGLLAQDPEGNGSAFLQCVAVEGVNGIGFWERKFCPNNMVFDFVGQQCKEEERKFYRKDISNKFNIAILNNSCARGEQCIGGTVCDLETLRCLCPYGTQADLDTLSCITPGMPSQFSGFSGFKQNPSQYGSSAGSGHIDVGFLPNPGQPQSNSVPFNFNFNANNNLPPPPPQQNFAGSNNQHQSNGFTDFFQPNPITGNVDFKPNPFIIPPAPQTKKLPILAAPGKSCREGELCTGGSLCTRPLGLCLCPGDLEERQGECVLPERASIHINKVGIGAICGDLAECDHGSSCVNGRCMCVAPLVQENGRCIMQAQVKEVGPGELCDNGEVCVKGSVCDALIPVCVCPPETDLRDGECIRIKQGNFIRPLPAVAPWGTPSPSYPTQTVPPSPLPSIPPQQPSPLPVQQAVSPPDQPYRPPVTYTTRAPFQPMPPVTQPPPQQPFVPRQPAPITEQPEQNVFPTFRTQRPNIITTPRPAPQQPDFGTTQTFRAINTPAPPSIKHNLIKLGGSKQAGVGVRCSLNTDCMVGAYCNGNTNPPSCQCLSTHVNVEGRCEKVIYPGQIGCLTDSQCTAAYTGTRCIDRSCVCPQGQKAVDQTCVPANEVVTSPPGGSCSGERECTGGSICREGWCVCPHPTMIVQKGICVQTQPRPTLPPRPAPTSIRTQPPTPIRTQPPTQAAPVYATAPPPARPHLNVGRKAVPGSQCGPLDTCVGGSMCVEGYCLCPAGSRASELGRCVPDSATATQPSAPAPAAAFGGANSAKYARPLTDCSNGEVCTGGSNCAQLPDGSTRCTCPPERPTVRGDHCVEAPARKIAFPGGACDENTACARGSVCQSGICQCHSGQIAIAGMCTTPPPPTASPVVTLKKANPFESCEDGETCVGGSSCDEDTGRCMCPVGMIVMLGECKVPPTTPKTPVAKSAGCQSDVECGGQRICVVGACKCKPGFVDSAGTCEPLEAVEFNERPAPVSYARHKVQSLAADEDGSAERTTAKPKPRRITGPPIRRPRPKTKITSSSSGGGSSGSNLKTGSGDGTCPPGNEPTRDESSGRIIMCNGLEPNCPPRSYCYITSGGFATEEYNCCKSW